MSKSAPGSKSSFFFRHPLWLDLFVAALSGVAGALAFAPLQWRWLLPLAPLGCFWSMSRAKTPRGAFGRAWLFGQIFYFGALQWLTSIKMYAPFPALAVLAIIALGGYIGLYTGLAGYVTRRWFNRAPVEGQFFAFAGIWLFQEWFRTLGRLACPLGFLSHAWAGWPLGIQIASVLGELGVTLELLIVAAMIGSAGRWVLMAVHKDSETKKAMTWTIALSVALIVIGAISINLMRSAQPHGKHILDPLLDVTLAQPNIEQMDKLASYAYPNPTIRAQVAEILTQNQLDQVISIQRPGLIVLPESAFTHPDFATNEKLRKRIAEAAKKAGSDVFFGANREINEPGRHEIYNSAWLVRADGTFDPQSYDKRRLVPFGEAMPYFNLIPGLDNLTGIGEFNEGGEATIFETHGHAFGALICFESMFASEARDRVRRGAEFLTVLTNDAWYGMSAGARYHHDISYLRAVETRRTVLRCANTGISSIIKPDGVDGKSLGLGEKGVIKGSVLFHASLKGRNTPYVRFGAMWLWLVAFGMAVLFVKAKRPRPEASENSPDKA